MTATKRKEDNNIEQGNLSNSMIIMFMFLFGFLTIWYAMANCGDKKLVFMLYPKVVVITSRMLSFCGDILVFLIGFNYCKIIKTFKTNVLIAIVCFCVTLAIGISSVVISNAHLPTHLSNIFDIAERVSLLSIMSFLLSCIKSEKHETNKIENRNNGGVNL